MTLLSLVVFIIVFGSGRLYMHLRHHYDRRIDEQLKRLENSNEQK